MISSYSGEQTLGPLCWGGKASGVRELVEVADFNPRAVGSRIRLPGLIEGCGLGGHKVTSPGPPSCLTVMLRGLEWWRSF